MELRILLAVGRMHETGDARHRSLGVEREIPKISLFTVFQQVTYFLPQFPCKMGLPRALRQDVERMT